MTDLFERHLSEQLRARPLPDAPADLGSRSIERAGQLRRRRTLGMVAVLVLLLLVPGSLWSLNRSVDRDRAPVVGPSSEAPAGSVWVTPDPVSLPPGPAPTLPYVLDGRALLPSRAPVDLPANQFGTVTEYWDDLAWLNRRGEELSLSFSPNPLRLGGPATEVAGLEPGPRRSVMVRTTKGPTLVTAYGRTVLLRQPELRTDRMVVSKDALWTEYQGQVVRISARLLEGSGFESQPYPQWKRVVHGDPRADRVAVEDGRGCQAVLNGSSAEVVLTTCDWRLEAFSPDGRRAAGRNADGAVGVLDLATGRLLLGVTAGLALRGPVAIDGAGQLNLVVQDESAAYAILTCPESGDCWRSVGPEADQPRFVLRN